MHASILTLPTLQSYGGILSHQTLIKASLSHCGGTITKETSQMAQNGVADPTCKKQFQSRDEQ